MHHECLSERLCNNGKALKKNLHIDFGAKFNQEISINMVNLASGSINEEKCKILGEVKVSSYATGSIM